jgi:hypothetical protein
MFSPILLDKIHFLGDTLRGKVFHFSEV